jgi:copper chaperone
MRCDHCKADVQKAVAGVDPGAHVDVDLGNRTVSIQSAETDGELIEALKAEGYEAIVA